MKFKGVKGTLDGPEDIGKLLNMVRQFQRYKLNFLLLEEDCQVGTGSKMMMDGDDGGIDSRCPEWEER